MRATAVDAAAISVRARVGGDVLGVEVGDGERRAPDLADGGAFGLNVAERLSWPWGVDRDVGTRVWAEVAFSRAG
jgi:hypothetical protein